MRGKRQRPGKEPMAQGNDEPLQTNWTPREVAIREKFENVKVHPTRFNDRQLLRKMGLQQGVDELLRSMGMECLRDMEYPTLPDETKDFLSTVQLEYVNPKDKKASEGLLTFKIGNKAYELTIESICEVFGFRNGEAVEFGSFGGASNLWNIIADGRYRSANAKMTTIRNPTIRYVCKLLANTFFARRDAGAVTMTELSLIYQGIKGKLTNSRGDVCLFEFGDEINYGCLFAQKLLSFKSWVEKTPKPDLYIGAMITPLLIQAGVNISKSRKLPTFGYLDQEYLKESWFLKRSTDRNAFHCRIELRNKEVRVLVLPHPETHVRTLQNIRFDLPEDQFLQVEQGGVQEEAREDSEDEAPRGSTATLQALDELEMPEIDFTPKTQREKFLHKAYKVQRKVNQFQKKLINKLFRKVKKLEPQGYVSSDSAE